MKTNAAVVVISLLLASMLSTTGCSSCDDDPSPTSMGADADAGAPDVSDSEPDTEGDAAVEDSSLDADVRADTDADVASRWLPVPALTGTPVDAVAVESAGTRVEVRLSPFGLRLVGPDGEARASTWEGPEAAYRGLALGVASGWTAQTYYEPTLTMGRPGGEDITWYSLDRVVSAVEHDGSYEVLVGAEVEGGEIGPWARLVVAATGSGVSVEVIRPEDPRIVYTSVVLEARPGEGYYGLGEQFDRLDSRGSIREMQIQFSNTSESATNEVHVGVSAYFSTEGYGLFAADRYPAAFDLGSTHEAGMRLTSLSPALPLHLVAVDSPMAFAGWYAAVAGYPARVPFWALAPQYWRNVNRDTAEVLDDAARARAMEVPASVVWIDRPWSSYYHNWRFNPSQFPDAAAMMDELRRLGYRVMLHHSPQLNPPGGSDLGEDEDASEGLYAEALAEGWLVRVEGGGPFQFPWGGGNGAHLDFSHPGAVARVQELLRRVTDLGVVGTKMDWDEYLQPNFGHVRLSLLFANGESNLTMRSWYSALYHKTIIEGFDAALGEPSFHVSRSGTPGDQVWNTCIWPGDLDRDFSEHVPDGEGMLNVGGMPAAMMANQSLGLSGYPCFASDIGGYRGGLSSEEVLARWLAFGTFNGVMQLGGGGGSHMPWTADTTYSLAALEIARRYFRLRMELLPYTYTWMDAAHTSGRPLVRSLYTEFPDDATTRLHERDFMFGPDLLVAPVYEAGAVTRSVYLPAGSWLDLWSGAVEVGPAVVERAAPLDVIPVYVRAGAIIPLADPTIDTVFPTDAADIMSYDDVRTMRVQVWPVAARASLALYNGVTVGVVPREAAFDVEVALGAPLAGHDPRWAFAPEAVTVMLQAQGTPFADGASGVEVVRGAETTSVAAAEDCATGECWWWDAAQSRVMVRLTRSGRVQVVPAL